MADRLSPRPGARAIAGWPPPHCMGNDTATMEQRCDTERADARKTVTPLGSDWQVTFTFELAF